MKGNYRNILVFVFVFAIMFCGYASRSFLRGMQSTVIQFKTEIENTGAFEALADFADNVEKSASQNLSYHSEFMDINSVFSNAVNKRIVEKDDMVVVKAVNGYLGNPRQSADDGKIDARTDKVKDLHEIVSKHGAEFLYIMAPTKGYNLQYPANITDATKSNCDRFISEIEEKGVPYLNLIESMEREGLSEEDVFFVTDHHWKPDAAFWAFGEICEELNYRYGFGYDELYTDISNYDVKTYEDWFLGSQGKKVGRYFTWLGADDINIITPKFKTSLTEEQPLKNQRRVGDFGETVMYMENVNEMDHYGKNPYAAYSGGDFREQIITNNLNADGKKILIIRDSFACAVVPFLSQVTSKLYVVDVRDNANYVGDKVNVSEYIEKTDPDYVLVLYTGVSDADDLFDFG